MSEKLLNPEYESLFDLFNDKSKRFNVPYYQRPYSWDDEQIDELWKDILSSYDKYKPENKHDKESVLYIGNMVIKQNQTGNYDVIDGQQRITTFSIFFLSMYSLMHKYKGCEEKVSQIRSILWYEVLNKPQKDQRLIELGSEIDQQILRKLFDKAFESPLELQQFAQELLKQCSNSYQRRIIHNFLHIYDLVSKKCTDSDSMLRFYCFLTEKIHLICITIDEAQKETKAITIFDSINSKGKQLEDIDSIKCWIFSKFNEEEYSIYLKKWGDLIVATNDKVATYLHVFIKALIKPSLSGTINYIKFKELDSELIKFFNVKTINDAYKSLLTSLIEYKDFYKALFDLKTANEYIKDSKFNFYYLLFTINRFEHLYPMFFKMFVVLSKQKCIEGFAPKYNEYSEIFVEAIKAFLIASRLLDFDTDSLGRKLCQKMCSSIIHDNWFDKDLVIQNILSVYAQKKINLDQIKNSILKCDFFKSPANKKLAAGLLALYNSWDGKTDFSWDQAKLGIENHSTDGIHLDHILPQHPKQYPEKEGLLKYAENGDKKKTVLLLKQGHDFDEIDENGNKIVENGMPYNQFLSLALNRIGNLKIRGADSNKKDSNRPHAEFVTWHDMLARNKYICDFITPAVFNVDFTKIIQKEKIPFELNVGDYDFVSDDRSLKPICIKFGDGTPDLPIAAWKDVQRALLFKAASFNSDKLLELVAKKDHFFDGVLSDNLKDFNATDSVSHLLNEKIHFKLFTKQQDVLKYAKDILEYVGFDTKNLVIIVKEK